MFKISIITAGYRVEFMDRVWESIKRQTFKDWEWIIVNDGQDKIREWYKKNKTVLYNTFFVDIEKRRGRFGLYARNVGTMVANNKHIIFLDDDNEWEADHLESLVKLEKETGKIPYCWMHLKGKKPDSTHDRIKKTHFGKQGIDLGCILWRKELFERYGYFRNDAQVTYDWNCIARVYYGSSPSSFVCTNKPTLIFWHRRY